MKRLSVSEQIILKRILKDMLWEHGMNSSSSGKGPDASRCKHDNELFSFVKDLNYKIYLKNLLTSSC